MHFNPFPADPVSSSGSHATNAEHEFITLVIKQFSLLNRYWPITFLPITFKLQVSTIQPVINGITTVLKQLPILKPITIIVITKLSIIIIIILSNQNSQKKLLVSPSMVHLSFDFYRY